MRALAIALILWFATAAVADVVTLASATIIRADGKHIPMKLEMALDATAREQGLMHRKTLAPADGMAFFFPQKAAYKFWMKNTLIPLDMLFVDEAGRIVYITTAKPLSLTPVGPESPVISVIEIMGGRAAREGINVGDKVRYETQTYPGSLAR